MGFFDIFRRTEDPVLTATERPMEPIMDPALAADFVQSVKSVTHPWFDPLQMDVLKSVGGQVAGTKAQRIKEYASAGEWLIRPGMSEPEYLRRWVQETEFLQAIHMTRKRQIMRFAHPARVIGDGGWVISLEDKEPHPSDEQKEKMA